MDYQSQSHYMKIVGLIPARYGSVRFPGKPLALIAGKALIQHVVERAQRAKSLHAVIVAAGEADRDKSVAGARGPVGEVERLPRPLAEAATLPFLARPRAATCVDSGTEYCPPSFCNKLSSSACSCSIRS